MWEAIATIWGVTVTIWAQIATGIVANLITGVLFKLRVIKVNRTRRGYQEIRIRGANQLKINQYLKDLFSRASSIDVVSNRLSWIQSDPTMADFILELAQEGKQFRFHLPADNDVARKIRAERQNVRVFISPIPDFLGEHPRFTLTDKNMPGSGYLAVGYSDNKDWLITEFNARDHTQTLAIARGYVESLELTGEEAI